MEEDVAFALLERAWALGVRAFDTAENYGVAAERLSQWLRSTKRLARARVCTKIKCDRSYTGLGGKSGVISDITDRANAAINRFEGAKSVLLLAHGYTTGEAWESLALAAGAMGAQCGQSVYGIREAESVMELDEVSRVQLPCNVFDNLLPDRSAPPRSRVLLDTRSTYLQGVLLDTVEVAERRVRGGGKLAAAVDQCARQVDQRPAALLIKSVLRRLNIGDRVIIGIERPQDLEILPLLSGVSDETTEKFERCLQEVVFQPIERRILDPRQW